MVMVFARVHARLMEIFSTASLQLEMKWNVTTSVPGAGITTLSALLYCPVEAVLSTRRASLSTGGNKVAHSKPKVVYFRSGSCDIVHEDASSFRVSGRLGTAFGFGGRTMGRFGGCYVTHKSLSKPVR